VILLVVQVEMMRLLIPDAITAASEALKDAVRKIVEHLFLDFLNKFLTT
jgi:hypothetical protein